MEKKGRFTVTSDQFDWKEFLSKPYIPTENEIRRVGRFTILHISQTYIYRLHQIHIFYHYI